MFNLIKDVDQLADFVREHKTLKADFSKEFAVAIANLYIGLGLKRNLDAEKELKMIVLEGFYDRHIHRVKIGKNLDAFFYQHDRRPYDYKKEKKALESKNKSKVKVAAVAVAQVVEVAPVVEVPAVVQTEWRIKVRQWLTRIDNKPVPCREMVGEIIRETAKAVMVKMHGVICPSSTCLHCGRELTHPVSLLYGIGPVCGEHFHINPLSSEAELMERYDEMKRIMANVVWEGWIPKTGIERMDTYVEQVI